MRDPRTRIQALARDEGRGDWYRITNKKDKTVRVDLLNEIGFWGTTAADMVAELKDIDAELIDLHINSPGGEVWDGITIYNALRDHKAKVVATVDGLAASAASFIAMAADELVMNRNSELMIHDASGLCWGNAADMQWMKDRLETMSDNIASIYADRAGGSLSEWRSAMKEETWYSAQEAVDAKLADRVVEGKADANKEKNRFDLSVFNHAGRSLAPEPTPVSNELSNAAGRYPGISSNSSSKSGVFDNKANAPTDTFQTNTQEDPLTADQLQKLGLPEDATQEQIDERLDALAALESTGGEGTGEGGETTTTTEPPAVVTPPSEGAPGTQPESTPSTEAQHRETNVVPEGVVMIDSARLQALESAANHVNAMREENRIRERDEFITNAISEGRFPPGRRDHWTNQYDGDPEGTREFVTNKLSKGSIPLEEIGHGKDTVVENKAGEEYSSDFFPHLQIQGAAK